MATFDAELIEEAIAAGAEDVLRSLREGSPEAVLEYRYEGSTRAMAAELGVTQRTVQRWTTSARERRTPRRIRDLQELRRRGRAQARKGKARQLVVDKLLRSRGGRIIGGTLSGQFAVTIMGLTYDDRPPFTVGETIDIPPAAMASILDHLRAGERDAAVQTFVDAFNRDYAARASHGSDLYFTPVDIRPFVIEPRGGA
jgi:hypothetical protein